MDVVEPSSRIALDIHRELLNSHGITAVDHKSQSASVESPLLSQSDELLEMCGL
jgi:hypothetical protein